MKNRKHVTSADVAYCGHNYHGLKRFLSVSWIWGIAAVMVLGGCRGQESEKPPIHLNPNMDIQGKYVPYGENPFFEDGRDMRPPVEGTVPRGQLREDEGMYTGKKGEEYIDNPMNLTLKFLERGRERYDIYCSVCHGVTGKGDGPVIRRGFVVPTSYYDERLRAMPDGEFFEIITQGIRNMPAYNVQIPVEDRWAIVAYIRAMQKSVASNTNPQPGEG